MKSVVVKLFEKFHAELGKQYNMFRDFGMKHKCGDCADYKFIQTKFEELVG